MTFCKICNNCTAEYSAEALEISTCPKCGYAAKKHLPGPQAEKERYMLHENSTENASYVDFISRFLDFAVIPFCNAGDSLLDFGCGENPVLAEILKGKRSDLKIYLYDKYFYTDADYKDKSYDLIILHEVLEHISEPLRTVAILKDLLNPGGRIAVSTLLHDENVQGFGNWWYIHDDTHVSFFSLQTIKTLAEKSDMKIIRSDSIRYTVLSL